MDFSRRGLLAAAGALPVLMTVAEGQAQGIAPKRGGVLQTMLTPEPPILQLGVNAQGPTLICGSKIFQGLLKFDKKLNPLPCLAKSWTVSDDKKEYVFHLQENVKWHDGEPFTADDVVFCLTKFLPEVSPRARAVFAGVVSCVAVDPHTVKVNLKDPFEPFLLMFDVTTAAMVAKHLFDGKDYRTAPTINHPIGTGPFKFAEWQRGSFIRLEKFDQYWKPGQPYLDGIVYRIIPDSQSRALALQTGQAVLSQGNDIEPFDVPRFRAMPNMQVETDGWEYFSPLSWIEINHRVKPLGDPKVRQAMSRALDRNFIAKRLWFGVGKPAVGPIASTTKYFDPAVKLPGFDLAAAKKLLDDAGYKPDSSGIRFSIKHLVLPYGEVWTRLSEYFKQSMAKIGIAVELESTDPGNWSRRIGAWDYETSVNFLYQQGDPTLGVERSYTSTNIQKITFTNTGGYSNPKVDQLFAEARTSADPAVRQKAFNEVTQVLVDDVPQIWLMELAFPTIHDKKVHNLITLGTGVNSNFDDVFIV